MGDRVVAPRDGPSRPVASAAMPTRIVIIGGGPAGNSCATTAARLGAEVTLIERDVIGGAAHLNDCIPSKAMIATGNARQFLRRSARMGLDEVGSEVDLGTPDIGTLR